jgi:hypothetical protein
MTGRGAQFGNLRMDLDLKGLSSDAPGPRSAAQEFNASSTRGQARRYDKPDDMDKGAERCLLPSNSGYLAKDRVGIPRWP